MAFSCNKLKINGISFGAKMVLNGPLDLQLIKVSFPGFVLGNTQLFGTARKNRGKGEDKGKKKVCNGQWQKNKSKFWLMRMHQIKIFHFFVPNRVEIYQFDNKIAFPVKLRPI